MPFESSITQGILNYLNSLPECIAEKTKGDSTSSGRADISGCYKGRALRIEVKTPDNKNVASKKQRLDLQKWLASGAIVCIAYSVPYVQRMIQAYEERKHSGCNEVYVEESENHCVSYASWKALETFTEKED